MARSRPCPRGRRRRARRIAAPSTSGDVLIHPSRSRDLLHKPVVSGLGEPIGVVVQVDEEADGTPKRLWIREHGAPDGAPLHRIKCAFIRHVSLEGITLKGPREGFHITRLAGDGPKPPVPPQARRSEPLGSGVVPMDTYRTREFPR